ncbi:hypothetical protein L1887_04968 [Cichorium endivia]|nr:hypothetical protein L1887_04968 [Cichorium endivia]
MLTDTDPLMSLLPPTKLIGVRASIEGLLMNNGLYGLRLTGSCLPTLSSSPENGYGYCSSMMSKFSETPTNSEKKEYMIDPSLPNIKNKIYSTDEFRMFSSKVQPCSRW